MANNLSAELYRRSSTRHARLRRRRVTASLRGLTFVSPWLVGFLAFTVGPMLLSLFYSFTNYNLISAPQFVGLANYAAMLQDPSFIQAIVDTSYMILIIVPLSMGAALMYGILMSLTTRLRGIYRTILYLPSLVPAVAVAILWEWLFNSSYGLIDGMLSLIGIRGPLWLSDSQYAIPVLIIMSLWGAGNSAVLFLAALQGVRRELYEQAMVDGAGMWARFRKVTLPMITPVLFFNLVTSVIGAVQFFTQAFIMFGGNVQFLMTFIYAAAFQNFEIGLASAASWFLLLFTTVLVAVLFISQRWWVFYDE